MKNEIQAFLLGQQFQFSSDRWLCVALAAIKRTANIKANLLLTFEFGPMDKKIQFMNIISGELLKQYEKHSPGKSL